MAPGASGEPEQQARGRKKGRSKLVFLVGLRGWPVGGGAWEVGLGPLLGHKAETGSQMGHTGGDEGMARNMSALAQAGPASLLAPCPLSVFFHL